MDTDDLEPIMPKKEALPGLKNLEDMSIEGLAEYIETLKSEIARAEQAVQHKIAARTGADAVFKK